MADILDLLHVARNSGAQAQLALFSSLGLGQLEEGLRVRAFNSVMANLGSQATQELGLRKLLVCLQQVTYLSTILLGSLATQELGLRKLFVCFPESGSAKNPDPIWKTRIHEEINV